MKIVPAIWEIEKNGDIPMLSVTGKCNDIVNGRNVLLKTAVRILTDASQFKGVPYVEEPEAIELENAVVIQFSIVFPNNEELGKFSKFLTNFK